MLDMQTKNNRFVAPAEFNVTQHDAAEFNSSMDEIKNAITDQGGVLTPAVNPGFELEDHHQLNKSIIAGGGWVMNADSVTANTATFTAAAAGPDNFPELAQYTEKFLRFNTSTVPNTGSYVIIYDGDFSSLLDLEGNQLSFGELPANTIVEIFFANGDWHLNGIFNPQSGGYIYGNSGVIFDGAFEEITNFCLDTRNFQIGEKGLLTSDDADDFWLSFNAYCRENGTGGAFDRIVSGQAAFRQLYFGNSGDWVNQYSPSSDGDINFFFITSEGMNDVGDRFWGKSTVYQVPAGDSDWTYEYLDNNKVRAQNKTASSENYLFIGTNCFPTGDPLLVNVIANGDWSFYIQDRSGQSFYSGNSIASSTFTLATIPRNRRGLFNNEQSSFENPVGLGSALDSNFLNSDPHLFQHRLGEFSSIGTGKDSTEPSDLLYDTIGHGIRTEFILGSTVESSFNALPDTNDVGIGLTFHIDGSVFGIGTTGLAAEGHVAKKPLVGSVSQIDPLVDTAIPTSAGNNFNLNRLFFTEGAGAGTIPDILMSLDSGLTWVIQHSEVINSFLTGIARLRDGTIVAVRYATQLAGNAPTPVFSLDDGDTWVLSANSADIQVTGGVTVGNDHFVYVQHSDGTIFFAGRGTGGSQYIKIFSASSISGTWTDIGEVGPNTNTTPVRGCLFIDQATDTLYVGMVDDADNLLIRRSVDKGVTFTTVFTENNTDGSATPLKIIGTPQGQFYAIIRTGATTANVLRSLDGGTTWEEIVTATTLARDIIYNPNDASIYLIRDNAAGGIGYIIETIAVEKDIATKDNTDPIKMRMYQGNFDVFNSIQEYDAGDIVTFGLPNLRVNREFMGMLQNPNAPITFDLAPLGCMFRNSADQNRMWVKEMNGDVYPVNGVFDPVLLTAGFLSPNAANTGAFETVELGAGADLGAYDVLAFPDTGDDFYYAQIQPPKNWYSKKIQFRVSYIVNETITAPATIGWELGLRKIVKDTGTDTTWTTKTEQQTLPDTVVGRWRKTDFSDVMELASFAPGVDSLNIRMNRDNGVGDNEDGDVLFSEVEIKWLP